MTLLHAVIHLLLLLFPSLQALHQNTPAVLLTHAVNTLHAKGALPAPAPHVPGSSGGGQVAATLTTSLCQEFYPFVRPEAAARIISIAAAPVILHGALRDGSRVCLLAIASACLCLCLCLSASVFAYIFVSIC